MDLCCTLVLSLHTVILQRFTHRIYLTLLAWYQSVTNRQAIITVAVANNASKSKCSSFSLVLTEQYTALLIIFLWEMNSGFLGNRSTFVAVVLILLHSVVIVNQALPLEQHLKMHCWRNCGFFRKHRKCHSLLVFCFHSNKLIYRFKEKFNILGLKFINFPRHILCVWHVWWAKIGVNACKRIC